MATPTTNDTLINQAACYKCIPDGAQPQVQTYLLDQLRSSLTAAWEDLVFPASAINTPGPGGAATLIGTSGQGAPGDQLALLVALPNNANFWATVQMPHAWVPRTNIYPHIHIQPQLNTANNITFQLSYQISDLDKIYPASTVGNHNIVIPAGSQWQALDYNIPANGIDMSAFSGPSTIIRLHYTMTAATNSINILSFDVHFFKSVSPINFNPLD